MVGGGQLVIQDNTERCNNIVNLAAYLIREEEVLLVCYARLDQ